MLQRLKCSYEHAKLLTGLEIRKGIIEDLAHAAQHFSAESDRGAINYLCENLRTLALGANRTFRTDFDTIQGDYGNRTAVDARLTGHREPRSVSGYEEKSNTIRIVLPASRAG